MKEIFLSYSWANKDIADAIDKDFKSIGITLIRDERDAPNYSSLSSFMGRIRDCDYAILLVGDKYLKSENCMFEVTEVLHEKDYDNKIIPILLNDSIKVREIDQQAEYIKLWEIKQKDAQKRLKELDPLNVIELTARINKIRTISQNIGLFLAILNDKKTVDYIELKKLNYKPILEFINVYDQTSKIDEILRIQSIDDFQEKEIELEKYAENYGNDELYYFTKGNMNYLANKYKASKLFYEKSLELNPDNETIHNNFANALSACGEYDRAKAHYEKAIEINPKFAEAYDNLANLLESDFFKDFAGAKKHHEKALELNPNNAGIHYNYASLLVSEEYYEPDEAIKHFEIAIDLELSYTEPYISIARLLVKSGDFSKALEYCKRALLIEPKDSYVHKEYADMLLQSSFVSETCGNYEEARKHYEIALELNPNEPGIHTNLANLLSTNKFKDYFGAKLHYEKALKLNPSDAVTHNQFALLLKSVAYKDYRNAIEHFEKAIELEQNRPEFHYNYANFLAYEYKYYRGAVLHYEKAIELEPDNPLYHYALAQLFDNALKDKKGTKLHYEIAEKLMHLK